MNEPTELTEGEKIVEEFFIDEQIEYKSQFEIKNLIGDSKLFRKSDFYLPKYKIHVEFFGQWNVSEEHKARYREKKRVYNLNKIPCIYLYPENLGTIKYAFNYRVKKELAERKMKKELVRFIYESSNREDWYLMPIFLGGLGFLLWQMKPLREYDSVLGLYLVFLLMIALMVIGSFVIMLGNFRNMIREIKRVRSRK